MLGLFVVYKNSKPSGAEQHPLLAWLYILNIFFSLLQALPFFHIKMPKYN